MKHLNDKPFSDVWLNYQKPAEKETETLVTIEEPPYEITMLEPDSIGNRYMEATLSLIRNL